MEELKKRDVYKRQGLGLYIVRKVMEMHRANYGISNINNGVLFWFELPCKQPVDNSI